LLTRGLKNHLPRELSRQRVTPVVHGAHFKHERDGGRERER